MAACGTPLLIKYGGEGSWDKWWEKYAAYAHVMDWTEERQLAALPLFLEGKAELAYYSLLAEDKADLKTVFEAVGDRLKPVKPAMFNYAELSDLERRRDETYEAFAIRVTERYKQVFTQESTLTLSRLAAQQFFRSLPKDIQAKIAEKGILTLEEMLQEAKLQSAIAE